ncbi:hypothetical protein CANCADRAFT_57995 [Tortispora caseinolytica NRRL Y-17796]|uniref:Uncharacterized protein n=1 Tax=Tortispora caseinolytica NRRL Y-17796 TaxID=767744 RepID=A0A1E4TB14_9ASCO|nr:hypothetical protein CANCADRAFT_57995 [Tortispora caseinolytica NRRL Y-17796]
MACINTWLKLAAEFKALTKAICKTTTRRMNLKHNEQAQQHKLINEYLIGQIYFEYGLAKR